LEEKKPQSEPMFSRVNPEVIWEGCVWTNNTSTSLKSMELKFEISNAFEETNADGRKVTACVILEGKEFFTLQYNTRAGSDCIGRA
jgi:hypothetical protein